MIDNDQLKEIIEQYGDCQNVDGPLVVIHVQTTVVLNREHEIDNQTPEGLQDLIRGRILCQLKDTWPA